MTLPASIRKFTLTAHITASVGWLGSVASFLALAIAGAISRDDHTVRSAYVALQIVASVIIVPLSFASLITGLVQSLGTAWGLFRHYWVIAKLIINVLSTLTLLLHMNAVRYMADAAMRKTVLSGDLRSVRLQLIADAAAAVVALLIATFLSVYKPRGITPYGWRKQREEARR